MADDKININKGGDGKDDQALVPYGVEAEIKIKEKRIIDFFLDPFRKYTHEALRER